jgi:uncharacterized protein (DUF1684 family)
MGLVSEFNKHQALSEFEQLWDWRRRVADLYGCVRSSAGPAGWQLWRAERDRLFAAHPQSPLDAERRARFSGLTYFDYDPALRLYAELVAATTTQRESLDIGRDGTAKLLPFACTNGLKGQLGNELTLYWIEGYGGGVFLPFADATNGTDTFAGGRYLLDTIKGADLGRTRGRIILDFNFAYNPSCAYSERWTCPLPPASNRLVRAVCGGERHPQ